MINFDNWKIKTLGEIFGDNGISKYGDVENVRALEDGTTNYVSTSRFNNGISKLVENTDYIVEKGNCITVGIDGSFAVFYQKEDFIRTTNIATLRHNKLNLFNSLFIVTLIRTALSKHYYGVKLKKDNLLARTEIIIPWDEINDCPNWDFMENYIKTIYKISKKEFSTKTKQKTILFKFEKWVEVPLLNIFEHERGQRYKSEDHKKGDFPYVSSTADNNGIDGILEKGIKSKVYHDCLTIANSGSRGFVSYHEGKFIASDHATVLWRKDGKPLTLEQGLFIKPILELNKDRFLFNKEINEDTIKEITILLPYIDGNPDWDYMVKYIKSLPNSDLIN